MNSAATVTTPRDRVIVRNGQVVLMEHWTNWNGQPCVTIEIRREADGSFTSNIGEPEHGGGQMRGTLNQVLSGLHPTVAKEYLAMFGLTSITADSTDPALKGYEIIMK